MLLLGNNTHAQTATDFTATDCDGIANNLFTELDNGKIVVLVWVEPCVGCISDAKAAYDAVMSYGASNPGKVKYWLIDDIGDSPCNYLTSWAISSNIVVDNIQIFSNAGDSNNENNYGGMGMPHVVVVGNSSHHIYLNLLNGANDGPAIANAINQAITNGVDNLDKLRFKVYPNPVNNVLKIDYCLQQPQLISLELYDVLGRCIKRIAIDEQLSGNNSYQLPFSHEMPAGNYFLKCQTNTESKIFPITKTNF